MKKYTSTIMSLVFMLVLAACGGGGGGGGGSSQSAPPQDPPDTYSVAGFVQKGPFISGSSITIQELDDNLNPTGLSYETDTIDDLGSFLMGSVITSKYIEIIATGFYFNEVTGVLSDAPLTLRTISEVSSEVNINLLTSLASKRIKKLMTDGMSFDEARTQAEVEVLNIFNIESVPSLRFDQMDISQEGDSNAILLAVSSILQVGESEAQLSQLISKIALDIENDGVLSNQTIKDEIKGNSMDVDTETVRTNLENLYLELGLPTVAIPDATLYVDSDGDGALNKDERLIVTYSGNGNTGGDVPVDTNSYLIISGQTVTVLENTDLVKTSYVFVGWNTHSTGNGITYTSGQTFVLGNIDVTLYAKWNQLYSVVYDKNGNTGGSVPIDSNSYQQGQTATVVGNTGNLVKTGYSFTGWNTQSNGGGVTYSLGDTFVVNNIDVTLYAKWLADPIPVPIPTPPTPIICTSCITYYFDAPPLPMYVEVSHPAGTILYQADYPDPKKYGSSFQGWYESEKLVTFPYTMPNRNVTFAAKWVYKNYWITYDYNGGIHQIPMAEGSAAMSEDQIVYDVPSLEGIYIKKPGCIFTGWFDESNNLIVFPWTMPGRGVAWTAGWDCSGQDTRNTIIKYLLYSLITIPSGEFNSVTIPEFKISSRISQAQYGYITGGRGEDAGCCGHIISNITWDEAMEFCSILSEITGRTFTLPTGAQVRYEYDRLKGKHHPWWYNYYWCLDLDSEGNHVAERGDGLKIHDTSIISLRVVEN